MIHPDDLVEAASWSLLHSLWQGALIAGLLAVAVRVMRGRPASERYLVRTGALLLMAAAPLVTFFLLVRSSGAAPIASSGSWPPDASGGPFSLVCRGLVSGWLGGVLVLGVRLAGGYAQVMRIRRRARLPLPDPWQCRFDRLAAELGLRAPARLAGSADLAAPLVVGLVRPVVLVPARVLTGLSPGQIEAILAHELAHVYRYDGLVNILQSLVETVLFYHPAVWWVSRGIRAEREYCCDDIAVALTDDPLGFARALTTLESWRVEEPQLVVSSLGGSLMQRVQRLIAGRPAAGRPLPGRTLAPLTALVAIGSVGAAALALTAPGPEPSSPVGAPAALVAPGSDDRLAGHEIKGSAEAVDPQGSKLPQVLSEPPEPPQRPWWSKPPKPEKPPKAAKRPKGPKRDRDRAGHDRRDRAPRARKQRDENRTRARSRRTERLRERAERADRRQARDRARADGRGRALRDRARDRGRGRALRDEARSRDRVQRDRDRAERRSGRPRARTDSDRVMSIDERIRRLDRKLRELERLMNQLRRSGAR